MKPVNLGTYELLIALSETALSSPFSITPGVVACIRHAGLSKSTREYDVKVKVDNVAFYLELEISLNETAGFKHELADQIAKGFMHFISPFYKPHFVTVEFNNKLLKHIPNNSWVIEHA